MFRRLFRLWLCLALGASLGVAERGTADTAAAASVEAAPKSVTDVPDYQRLDPCMKLVARFAEGYSAPALDAASKRELSAIQAELEAYPVTECFYAALVVAVAHRDGRIVPKDLERSAAAFRKVAYFIDDEKVMVQVTGWLGAFIGDMEPDLVAAQAWVEDFLAWPGADQYAAAVLARPIDDELAAFLEQQAAVNGSTQAMIAVGRRAARRGAAYDDQAYFGYLYRAYKAGATELAAALREAEARSPPKEIARWRLMFDLGSFPFTAYVRQP